MGKNKSVTDAIFNKSKEISKERVIEPTIVKRTAKQTKALMVRIDPQIWDMLDLYVRKKVMSGNIEFSKVQAVEEAILLLSKNERKKGSY